MDEAAVETDRLLSAGDYDAAYLHLDRLYRFFLEVQPQGKRLHKGWMLNQMGIVRLVQDRPGDAYVLFLSAFVEDALSRAEESRQYDELGRSASINLVFVFDVPGAQLADLAERLRAQVSEKHLFQTPEAALEAEPLRSIASATADAAARKFVQPRVETREPAWRRLDEFGTPWEDRVFVGGSYSQTSFPLLREIRDEVRRHGLDGVLVAEFKAPSDFDELSKSIRLMRQCRRAVFELSEPRGQYAEIEHLPDTNIRSPLGLYSIELDAAGQPGVSTLAKQRIEQQGGQVVPYDGVPDMLRIVDKWLRKGRFPNRKKQPSGKT